MPADVRKALGLPAVPSWILGYAQLSGRSPGSIWKADGSAERFRTSVGIAELYESLFRESGCGAEERLESEHNRRTLLKLPSSNIIVLQIAGRGADEHAALQQKDTPNEFTQIYHGSICCCLFVYRHCGSGVYRRGGPDSAPPSYIQAGHPETGSDTRANRGYAFANSECRSGFTDRLLLSPCGPEIVLCKFPYLFPARISVSILRAVSWSGSYSIAFNKVSFYFVNQ